MPRHGERGRERDRCWNCERRPADQVIGHTEDCDGGGDCYCDEESCEACEERQKWLILNARLRNDIARLEMAGKMMEYLVKYSKGARPDTTPGAPGRG